MSNMFIYIRTFTCQLHKTAPQKRPLHHFPVLWLTRKLQVYKECTYCLGINFVSYFIIFFVPMSTVLLISLNILNVLECSNVILVIYKRVLHYKNPISWMVVMTETLSSCDRLLFIAHCYVYLSSSEYYLIQLFGTFY